MQHKKRENVMNFIKRMNQMDFKNQGMVRIYSKISFEINVALSIQASYGHYCIPKKTINLEEYTHMEIAIFKNDEFVDCSEVIMNKELIEKLNEHFDGSVYSFVPVELIEELYVELNGFN